jgi:hypothetical protein
MANTTWVKTATGDHIAGPLTARNSPRFRIRGPLGFTKTKLYWLYIDGHRYTPTGRYVDAVSFRTLAQARTFAENLPVEAR